MEELRSNEKWVIPALKQMKEICMLYLEVRYLLSCSDVTVACNFIQQKTIRYIRLGIN